MHLILASNRVECCPEHFQMQVATGREGEKRQKKDEKRQKKDELRQKKDELRQKKDELRQKFD